MKNARNLMTTPGIHHITYNEFIYQHVLEEPVGAIDVLANRLCERQPEIDRGMLNELLLKPVKWNAGIMPLYITPKGSFIIAGHSQRQGDKKREVLLNAMGGVESSDKTILAAACRELDEELGPNVSSAFKDNLSNSIFYIQSNLGENLDAVAKNVLDHLRGQKHSLSLYGLMLSFARGNDEDMNTIIENGQALLSLSQTIYPEAVSWYYHDKKTCVDFISKAESLMPLLSEAISSRLQNMLDDCKKELTDETLRDLVKYLIEITENDKLILLNFEKLSALSKGSLEKLPRLINFTDENNQQLQLFRPTVINLSQLLSLKHHRFIIELNQSPLAPRERSIPYHQQQLAHLAPKIIESLLWTNAHYNPRALSISGHMQNNLGLLYDQARKQGARLEDWEIPSHVDAADIQDSVNQVMISPGETLYQYVRPQGWIGDYYARTLDVKPEALGISAQVTSPIDISKVVDRVTLKLFVKTTARAMPAAVSKAKAVGDTWSIQGQKIPCCGGGEQVYMPLGSVDKTENIVIVLPENNPAAVLAIASKNGMQTITEKQYKEACQQSHTRDVLPSLPQDAESLALNIIEAYRLGHYQVMSKCLKQYLEFSELRSDYMQAAMLILSVLNALKGKLGQAHHLYQAVKARRFMDIDIKALFFTDVHLARAAVTAEEAISRLKDCAKTLVLGKVIPLTDWQYFKKVGALIKLEMGVQYNRIISRYSDEMTFHDFNEAGERNNKKLQLAENARRYFNGIDTDALPMAEQAIFYMEHAFTFHRLKKYHHALEELKRAKCILQQLQESCEDEKQSYITEIEIQLKSVELMFGLCLARLKGLKKEIPHQYQQIDPVTYLLEMAAALQESSPMTLVLLLKRWIGPNANNLFIQGWYYKNPNDEHQGANLISLYRKYIPLDLNQIISDLEANRIDELDLAYLGMPLPGGISDDNFKRFTEALSKNQSLKKLFIRKFAAKSDREERQSRAELLFTALELAQSQGQALKYLSYSGIRLNTKGIEACLQYLKANRSLTVLQPSLFDFDREAYLQYQEHNGSLLELNQTKAFAEILQSHPRLKTVFFGLSTVPGTGEMLYKLACKPKSLKYIHPFPGRLRSPQDDVAIENRKWLKKLDDLYRTLLMKKACKNKSNDHYLEDKYAFEKEVIAEPLRFFKKFKKRIATYGPNASMPEFRPVVQYLIKKFQHPYIQDLLKYDEKRPLGGALIYQYHLALLVLRHVSVEISLSDEDINKGYPHRPLNNGAYPYQPTLEAISKALDFFDVIERLSKKHMIPLYHSDRYLHYELMLKHLSNLIILPSSMPLSLEDLIRLRVAPIFFNGVSDKTIFADGYYNSPKDFWVHDENHNRRFHSYNMIFCETHKIEPEEAYEVFDSIIKDLIVPSITLRADMRYEEQQQRKMIKALFFEFLHEYAFPPDRDYLIAAFRFRPGDPAPFEVMLADDDMDNELEKRRMLNNNLRSGFLQYMSNRAKGTTKVLYFHDRVGPNFITSLFNKLTHSFYDNKYFRMDELPDMKSRTWEVLTSAVLEIMNIFDITPNEAGFGDTYDEATEMIKRLVLNTDTDGCQLGAVEVYPHNDIAEPILKQEVVEAIASTTSRVNPSTCQQTKDDFSLRYGLNRNHFFSKQTKESRTLSNSSPDLEEYKLRRCFSNNVNQQ